MDYLVKIKPAQLPLNGQNETSANTHVHFVREHHKKVERVAIVTDSKIAGIGESLAKHFTSAEIKHYPFSDDVKALKWLETA